MEIRKEKIIGIDGNKIVRDTVACCGLDGSHEYSERKCRACGLIFCSSCSGYSRFGASYQHDSCTCPRCGQDDEV